MSEKYDDDDLDFDDDFGDFDMDPFSEPPIPEGRSPITHSLLKTGRKFTESFTDDKLETARKYVDASIPSEISSEAYDIKRILSGAQEGYREAINEVRNEAKPFFSAMDNVIPKGGKLETLVNFAREKMGLNDTEKNYEQIAEDSANKAATAVSEILGEQRTKEEYHNLVRDNIRAKRELSGLEIAATTAGNLEFINRFNQEVVSKYQRKSLELQYRHLYTADEQLSVTKTAFDGFKNQLESIVINSALPELTKMHNSEFVQAKLYDKLTDGLFSKEGTVGAIRNKFMQEIKGIGNVISGGMQAATSGLETYDNMKEMSKMAGGIEGIFASLLSDGLINVIGRKTGDIIAKTNPGNRLVNYVRNVMIDPSEQFRKDAEGREEGFMKSFFSFASDFTRVNAGEKTYSLSNGDGRDVAVFDNNTQTSITKIIPGLLTKILASVDSIKTGRDQEELRYNRDKGTFETVSETKNNLTSGILKDFERSGTKRNLRYVTEDLDKMMKANFKFKDSEKEDVREGILRYIYSGKSLHPDTLEENGFYKNFDKKVGLKLKIAIGRYIRQDNTGRNKRYLKDYFERIRTSTPDPMKMMRSHNDSGNMDLLIEEGYVTWDDDNKSYKLVNDTIKDLFSKDSRKDIYEEEKKERTYNSMFEKATYEYIDKSKDKYKEKQAKKEQDAKDDPEGKNLSNWRRRWNRTKKRASDVGTSIINVVNTVDKKGLSGLKEDITAKATEFNDKVKEIKTKDDLTNAIKDINVVKKAQALYEDTVKFKNEFMATVSESNDPKDFIKRYKETDSYKKGSKEIKDIVDKISKEYNTIITETKEDIESTELFKNYQKAHVAFGEYNTKIVDIFKEVVDPYVKKLIIKIVKTLDSDKVPVNTKIKLINHLVVNLGKLSNSLDKMLLDPINLDEEVIKDITKLTNHMKKNIARLKKFNVTKEHRKLSPLVRLALDTIIRAGKYTSTKKVNEILEEAKNIIVDNIETGIDKVNNEFSRSNENNAKMKFTNFTTNVQEGVSNIMNNFIKKPVVKNNTLNDMNDTVSYSKPRIPQTMSPMLASATTNRRRSPDELMDDIATMMKGNKIAMPDGLMLEDNGSVFNEKLLAKINFNTQYYPKEITENFKNLLRNLNVNDKTLNMLTAFRCVVLANDLPPTLGMAYLSNAPMPEFKNSLIINSNLINENYPNIKYEIHNLIAHEYKHHLQAISGKLVIGTNPNHYENTVTWKNKVFRAAEYLFPFKKYLSSDWEKEAYTEGYGAIYDQLVGENKIDESKTSKKSWVGKLYGKTYKLLKESVKFSLPAMKKDFESKGIEWLYDSNGNLLDKKPLSSITNNGSILASTSTFNNNDKTDENDIKLNSGPSMVDGNQVNNIVKDKPKTIFETVKEKTGSTFNKVKETLSISREEIFDKISSKAFDKLHNDLEEAGTDSYRKVLVIEFINKMTKILNKLDKIVKDNEKNASLKTKIKTLREKLKDLSETDISNTDKVNDKVETIKEELHIIADKALPADEVLENKSEEFTKKTVKQDEDTFLEILNSDDPVGALKAKVNRKIKSMLKKGIVGTYNFGKKIVKADLERGKKLRGYLKDKIVEKYNDRKNGRKGKPGFIRRGLNSGFNLLGTLLSSSGKGIKGATLSDLDNGKSMREFFINMFKKKPKEEKPKEQKNIHDRDGDGQTDGSWMSILKKRASGLTNKENYSPKALMETAKKPTGIAGIIAMGMMALSAMGVTMKDVASFAKGAWDVLKGVGKVLGGVWDTLKTVGGWIKDSFKWIKNKFSFGSDDKEDVKEEIDKDKARISELMKADKTDTDEYRNLVNKVSDNEKKLTEMNEEDDGSNASMLGTAAGVGATAYLGKKVYNVGKAGYNIVKGGVKAVTGTASVVKGVVDKVTPNKTPDIDNKVAPNKVSAEDLSKKKFSNSKIMTTLRSFKTYITKKFKGLAGKKILSNLAKKIAARAVPIAGLAVLAYDVGKITYDVFVNGTELKSAVSKQILGFDLFSDTDVPKDENGNDIKPDDNLDITDTTSIVKTKDDKLDKRIEEADKNVSTIPKDTSIIKPNENNIVIKEESKEDTPIGTKVSNWVNNLKDRAKSIKDNVVNKVSVGWEKVKGFVSKGIGAVAAYFESGKAGAGTISSGRGDRGGVSYGTHQLASKTGTLQEYIKGSKYSSEFAGLTPATPAFDAKWKEIFARDPEGFAEDQEAFIARSHYLPQVKNLSSIGLDLNSRSDALKSAVFSVGVQFGPGSKLINKAIAAKQLDPKSATDEDLIRGIYGFKKEYNDALFKSSSDNVRAGTLKRAFKEEDLVLSLLAKEGYKDPVANVQNKVGTEASNNVTYTPEAPTATVDTNTVNTNNNVSSTVASTSPETTKTEVTPNTSMVSSPVDKTIGSSISNNITPTSTVPQTVSTVDSSAISAISETNKGLNTINNTLLSSLEVQKQTLEAIKNLSNNLTDKSLNLSKEEKIDTPNKKEKFDDKNLTQSLGTPNINLSRKKYA